MPVKALEAYAKESGKSLAEAEKAWSEAKEAADKKFKKKDLHYWAYVNTVTRAKLGLKEESSSK